MSANESKRLDWIDVSKAFGVSLVILGHLVIFNYHTFRFIFAFHMPFFFVVAGFVWKEKPWKVFLQKCCRYYLLPYVLVLVLGVLQCLIIPMWGRNLTNFLTPEMLEKSFYHGHPCYSFFGSAWFLIAMFWAQILFWCMRKIGTKSKKYISVLLWLLLVLAAVFAKDIFSSIPIFERLPLKMDSALMATVFMGIGALLKKSKIFEKTKWYLSLLCVVLGGVLTWLFGCKWNYYVNMCDLEYAKEYNYFIAAIAGSIMLFGLGQLFQKSKILKYIGKNTLIIFLSHEFFYIVLIQVVNALAKKDFIPQYMKLDVWSIGISLVTLALSIGVVWLWEQAKLVIKNAGKAKKQKS